MISVGNKDIVLAFIEAQNIDDLDKQRGLLSDDVRLHIPLSAQRVMNIPSMVEGADQYIQSRRSAVSKIYRDGTRNMTMHHVIADGALVAAFYNMKSELVEGGDYKNEYGFLYRLKGNKISDIWEYTDTANAYLQFGFNISKS